MKLVLRVVRCSLVKSETMENKLSFLWVLQAMLIALVMVLPATHFLALQRHWSKLIDSHRVFRVAHG